MNNDEITEKEQNQKNDNIQKIEETEKELKEEKMKEEIKKEDIKEEMKEEKTNEEIKKEEIKEEIKNKEKEEKEQKEDNEENEKNEEKEQNEQNSGEENKKKSEKTLTKEFVIDVSKSPDFKQIYAIGAMGIHNIYDFRLSFYNDEPAIPNNNVRKFKRIIGTEIILSPIAALDLAVWLNKSLEEYEQRFGPIKRIQPQIQSENAGKVKKQKSEQSDICEYGMDGYA